MSQISDYAPGETPITGRKVLLIVLAFFGVIIAANMTMLYFAVNNFAGLVVKNSYVASQKFEDDRAKLQAAALTKWKVVVEAEEGALVLLLAEPGGAPVIGANLSGVIGRRSHDREDRVASFSEVSPGRYRADATLSAGAWRLKLRDAASEGVSRSIDFYALKAIGAAS